MHAIYRVIIFATLCSSVWLSAADGTRNLLFNTSGNTTAPAGGGNVPGFWYLPINGLYEGGRAYCVAIQGDKILVGGFLDYNGGIRPTIVRLNSDGTLDTTFGSSGVPGFVYINTAFFNNTLTIKIDDVLGENPAINSLVVLPDNSIVAACTVIITNPSSIYRFAVVKMTPDGIRDTTFQTTDQGTYGGNTPGIWYITGGIFNTDSEALCIVAQSDGKLIVGGYGGIDGVLTLLVVRLNADGTLDTNFNSGSVAPNGIIPGMWYKADAATTPVNVQTAYFGGNTSISGTQAIKIQANGSIVIGANFYNSSLNRAGVMRLTSGGKIDSTFNTSGSGIFGGSIPGYYLLLATSGNFSAGAASTTYLDSSGNILVGGGCTYNSINSAFVMRLLPTGVIDSTFNTSGTASTYGENVDGFFIISNFSGSINTQDGVTSNIIIDQFSRILFTGSVQNNSFPTQKIYCASLTSQGKLDTTFNPTPGSGNPYGGNIPGIYYFSTETTGTPFNGNISIGTSLTVLNEQLLLSTWPTDSNGNNFLSIASIVNARGIVNISGMLQDDTEPPFGNSANGRMYGSMLDSNNKLVLCGNYNNILSVVKYNIEGTPVRDLAFNVDGVVQLPALGVANGYAVTQDSSGNYYIAAESTVGGNLVFTLIKLDNDGEFEFAAQETGLGIGRAKAVKMNTDGTILVGGQTTVNGVLLPTLIAYTPTGSKVPTFGTGGIQTFSTYGTGSLEGLSVINISLVAAVGQTGNKATILEFGQSTDLLAQLNNGF